MMSVSSMRPRKNERRRKDVRYVAVSSPPNVPVKMQYISNGLAAEFHLDQTNSISLANLEVTLAQDCPIDGKVATYNSIRFGGTYIWLPSRVKVVMSHYLSRLKSKAEKIDKIKHVFSQKKCMLARQSMSILTWFGIHNSGDSDQAFMFALAAAWKVLF